MNARGLSGAADGMRPEAAAVGEGVRLIARRGITYGRRDDAPDATNVPPGERPEAGVGLLFVCAQASIEHQFEFLQRRWANDAGYSPGRTGVPAGRDLLIGQGRPALPALVPHADGRLVPVQMPSCVTLKGGEYFFAPSFAFFRRL
jgi:hypothetical protein